MDYRQHRADGKRELIPNGHINQDAEQGQHARDHSRLPDFLTDRGADVVLELQVETSARNLRQHRLDFVTRPSGGVHAERLMSADQVLLILNEGVFDVGFGEGGSQYGFIRLMLEGEHGGITAEEIHAKGAPAAVIPPCSPSSIRRMKP